MVKGGEWRGGGRAGRKLPGRCGGDADVDGQTTNWVADDVLDLSRSLLIEHGTKRRRRGVVVVVEFIIGSEGPVLFLFVFSSLPQTPLAVRHCFLRFALCSRRHEKVRILQHHQGWCNLFPLTLYSRRFIAISFASGKQMYLNKSILENSKHLGPGGSTAVTAIVVDGKDLWIANIGDSRAVLSETGAANQLTVDHEPHMERSRIEKQGGFVTIFPGNDFLSTLVINNQEAVDLVKSIKDPQAAAKRLTTEALARKSKDDISCIMIRFIC
ncbi:hypothetical protein BHM03_00023655 [Ensete ventricosum]|nr:hypothetical protein BHM03_00023655 [Ensete ventricosum]